MFAPSSGLNLQNRASGDTSPPACPALRRSARDRRAGDPGAAAATPPPPTAVTRAALDPVVGGRPRGDRRLRRAGGGERRHHRQVIGPGRDAYTLPAEASGREAVSLQPGPVCRIPLAQGGQRDHRSVLDSGCAERRWHHLAVDGHRHRHAPEHDADVAVRLAVQPLPVLQRPECRCAAPGLVDHRMLLRPGLDQSAVSGEHSVPAQPLLRRTTAAAGPRPSGPATPSG